MTKENNNDIKTIDFIGLLFTSKEYEYLGLYHA